MNEAPQVVIWFKVYCGFMAFLYFLVFLLGFVFLVVPAEDLDMAVGENLIAAGIFFVLGLPLMACYLVGIFLGPKSWVWVYDLVLICIGLTSCITMVVCIPLLIHWMKPELKAYYGRT